MLKGLRGILEKGLQKAAPIIGGSMFGAPGAMFGSGIASLLSGDKAQDALIKAGMSGMAGYRGADGSSIIDRATAGPVQETINKIINRPNTTDPNKKMNMGNLFNKSINISE